MFDVEKICVKKTTSLRDLIKIINKGRAQIALVVNDEKRLIGTITDGDIRRGLLGGHTLESSAQQFMFKDFSTVNEKTLKSRSVFFDATKITSTNSCFG